MRKINLALLWMLLSGPPTFSQSIHFTNWQVKDGLPQNSVTDIIQADDGYLWLATAGGLVKFDGVSFNVFNTINTPILRSNRVLSFYKTKTGDFIIIAHESGVLVNRKNQIFNFSGNTEFFRNYYIAERINYLSGEKKWTGIPLFAEDDKYIYLYTQNLGVVVIDPLTYEKVAGFEFLEYFNCKMYLMGPKEIYFELNGDIFQIDNETKKRLKVNAPADLQVSRWFDITSQGTWSINKNTLTLKKDNKIASFPIPTSFAPISPIMHWGRSGDEIVMIGNDAKYSLRFHSRKGTFRKVEHAFNTEVGRLYKLFTDHEGNLWYATATGGLFKEKPQRFQYIDTDPNIKSRNFYPVARSAKGHIFIGSQEDAYYEFDTEGKLIPITGDLIKMSRDYNCFNFELHNNTLYVPDTRAQRIYRVNENKFDEIYFTGYLDGNTLLYHTRKGEIIASTFNHIYLLVNDSLVPHPTLGNERMGSISCFYEDRQNKLWIISDIGIFRYTLNSNEPPQTYVSSVKPSFFRGAHEDSNSRMYIGSYGNGLTIIDKGKIIKIDTRHGLPENVISTITEDRNGNIWFTGNMGLTRVRKAEFDELIDGKRTTINISLYNETTDELRTGEFNGGSQHSKCSLGNDVYLFPSINGCVKVDFANFRINEIAPKVNIEKVKLGDSMLAISPIMEIKYSEKRLDISYAALSFMAPGKVRFRYKLAGYDVDWVDGGTERKTFYQKIPPGNYTFYVKACNDEGVWNESAASFSLRVIPPFYMTWWFRALSIALSLFLTGLIVWLTIRTTRRREHEKSILMDLLPDLVLKLSSDGEYLDIYGNPSALIQPFSVLKGKSIRKFIPSSLADLIDEKTKQAIETDSMQQFEYDLETDGILRHFDGRIIAIDKSEVLLIIRDISETTKVQSEILDKEKQLLRSVETEKKLLQKITEQQKNQLEAVIQTEENERRRIAADLHDGIGQSLSSVRINLSMASEKLSSAELDKSADLVKKSKDIIEQITKEIRAISYNLLPPSLEQFGLVSAIGEEVKKLNSNPRQEIKFYSAMDIHKLDSTTEIILFRAFQEMVNNAIRHSAATDITVQVIQHKQKILLMVEDNGKGFNVENALRKKDSSGLKNLYARAVLINGVIEIDSNPNTGTIITIEVPVKERR